MARLKLPAMMFYFGDWFKATDVRGCSLAARGLWIDMLGIMWEGDNPGYLESNGTPLNATFIGRVIGEDKGTIETLIGELDASGVFSRDERGCIYCRRMVKDVHKRLSCSEAGRRGGGNPLLKTFKGTPKGRVKGGHEYENEDASIDTNEIKLATRLYTTIQTRNPGQKKPDLSSWAKHIDLMIRLDKRDPAEIEKVIDWCQADTFWQNNILSTEKLRKQYDQLVLKMKQGKPGLPAVGTKYANISQRE